MSPRPLAGLAGLAMASWLLACAPGPRDPEGAPSQIGARERLVLSDGWLAMGTFFEVDLRVPASERSAAREWISGLRAEIARLESLYSRHDPDSALSALNRRLAEPGPLSIELEPELSGLIDAARRLSEETEGAFDATIGPLVELWWEAARDGREPESATLESARRRVGSSRFALSRAGRLESETGRLRIDLDAVSKGAVLDRVAADFRQRFPEAAALLSFGPSSVVAIGDPDGAGWRVELRSREAGRPPIGTIRLRDRALSMSSSLGRSSEIDGRIVSHVIDPRSGRPVADLVEAAVVGDSARRVDAWSTALLVLGPRPASVEHAESVGLEAIVVDGAGRSSRTSGWRGLEVVADD